MTSEQEWLEEVAHIVRDKNEPLRVNIGAATSEDAATDDHSKQECFEEGL